MSFWEFCANHNSSLPVLASTADLSGPLPGLSRLGGWCGGTPPFGLSLLRLPFGTCFLTNQGRSSPLNDSSVNSISTFSPVGFRPTIRGMNCVLKTHLNRLSTVSLFNHPQPWRAPLRQTMERNMAGCRAGGWRLIGCSRHPGFPRFGRNGNPRSTPCLNSRRSAGCGERRTRRWTSRRYRHG